MNQQTSIEYGWEKTAHYRRYGHLVVDAVAAVGRFQGTAAELAARAALPFDARTVGPSLHAALDAGLIEGTVRRKRGNMPCVYDVWAVSGRQRPHVQPVAVCPWMEGEEYRKYGKHVLQAVSQMGRFQGTAEELVRRAGIALDSRVVGRSLQSAIKAGLLSGSLERRFQCKPYVYDVWIPCTEPVNGEEVPAEGAGLEVQCLGSSLDAAGIEAAVFAASKRYPELDGTDAAVCRAILGRPPEADEVQRVRDVLLRMDDDCQIKFREIQRASAPALWEVIV